VTFQDLAAGDLWAAFRWVRDRDGIGGEREARIAWLTAEAGVRDALSRRMFELDAESQGLSQRRLTNLLVRIMPDEAWATGYLHTATSQPGGPVLSSYARCLARLERQAGGWRLADWHAPAIFTLAYDGLVAPGIPLPQPPEPMAQARAAAGHANQPFDGGRETWAQLRDDVWKAHHWLLDQPLAELGAGHKLEQLVDELLIREVLANYAYAHDSLDLAWTASVFTDDAMLVNERRVCDGNAQVVDMFREWNRGRVHSFHRFSNPLIRFVPDRPEAWFMAYFHVPHAAPTLRHYTIGRYFSRFTKRSGRWQIVDWRIANDARLDFPLAEAA
jgi:ketosteroid isomerase-like protein